MPDHTIAENLARLQAARTNISTAITTKGGTVPSGAGFEDFPTAIASIPEGTGDHDLFGVPATAQNPKLFTVTFSTTGTTTALAKMAEYWPFDEVTQDGKYYWGEDNYFTNGGATSYADEYVYAYYGSSVLNYFGSMSGESDKTVVIGSNFFLGIFSRCAIFCGYAEDKDGNVSKCMGMIPMTSHSDPIKLAFDNGGVKQYSNSSDSNADNQYTSILYGSDRYTVKDLLIAVTSQYIPLDPGAECTIGNDQAYLYSHVAALAKAPTAHAAPPIEFESDGSNLKNWAIFGNDPGVGEQTKNLVQVPDAAITSNGVTFTPNRDTGEIVPTVTGTRTGSAAISYQMSLPAGSYIFTCNPDSNRDVTYDSYLRIPGTSGKTIARDNDNDSPGNSFTLTGTTSLYVYHRIASSYDPTNLVFRPMLRPVDTSSDFEPYGYKIPVETRERGKNLFPVGIVPDVISKGVTLLVNDLESGTIEASADGSVDVSLKQIRYAEEPTIFKDGVSYTISATVDSITGDLVDSARIGINNGSQTIYTCFVRSVGEHSQTFTYDSSSFSTEARLMIFLTNTASQAGTIKLSNIMIRESSTSSDFEPYWKVADTTTIYTQTQLGTGDTITKEQTGVDIPTVDGENYITVATTTQPAAMTIAYAEPEE